MVCGDHFGLIVDRHPESLDVGDGMEDASAGGLVELVDALLAGGDRGRAIGLLSLEASHGRIGTSGGKWVSRRCRGVARPGGVASTPGAEHHHGDVF